MQLSRDRVSARQDRDGGGEVLCLESSPVQTQCGASRGGRIDSRPAGSPTTAKLNRAGS